VVEVLRRRGIVGVSEAEWLVLLIETELTESVLRRVLRELDVEVAPPFAGIRQKTLEELEASLLAMERVYREAPAERRQYCRRVVIEAKDHARLASRHLHLRAIKEEMVQWMLVWLENPEVFPAWVSVRKEAISAPGSTP
jgi:hypothetical protein